MANVETRCSRSRDRGRGTPELVLVEDVLVDGVDISRVPAPEVNSAPSGNHMQAIELRRQCLRSASVVIVSQHKGVWTGR